MLCRCAVPPSVGRNNDDTSCLLPKRGTEEGGIWRQFFSSAVAKTQRLSLTFPGIQSDVWHHNFAPFVNRVGRTSSFFFLMDERDSPDTWHSVGRWYMRFTELPVYAEAFYGSITMTMEQAH